MKLSQLLSPCLFGHGHTIRTRDEEGHLMLECEDCGRTTRLLDQPVIKGPKHYQTTVAGAPTISAKRVPSRERIYPRSA
jgi:hypothetical protein